MHSPRRKVLALVRDAAKGEELVRAGAATSCLLAELGRKDVGQVVAQALGSRPLHVLVNNAAVTPTPATQHKGTRLEAES